MDSMKEELQAYFDACKDLIVAYEEEKGYR